MRDVVHLARQIQQSNRDLKAKAEVLANGLYAALEKAVERGMSIDRVMKYDLIMMTTNGRGHGSDDLDYRLPREAAKLLRAEGFSISINRYDQSMTISVPKSLLTQDTEV